MSKSETEALTFCRTVIWPSWANRWVRCGSAVTDPGMCAHYGHYVDYNGDPRDSAEAARGDELINQQQARIEANRSQAGEESP